MPDQTTMNITQRQPHLDEAALTAIRQGVADINAGRVTPAEDVFTRLETKYGTLIEGPCT